jgi:polysaccharide export outer membrane protein
MFLGACSTLPNSGPTGREVRKSALADPELALSIVEVDRAASLPSPMTPVQDKLVDMPPPPTDMVGPGDVLGITIYEAGVTLFAAGGSAAAAEAGVDPGVRAQSLPETRVNDDGYITIPYAGKLHVLGKTVGEIEAQIRGGLRGFSQNPQVVVTRREIITNAVIVGGEVSRPGRLVLQTNRETLSDVVALAGGYKGRSNDLRLRITRAGTTSEMRLSALLDGKLADVRAYPGDRLTLVSDPLSFSVLGAAGRMEQIPFTTVTVTLAQAIAMAGGPNGQTGDPAAIFVFRYVADGSGERRPTVYHINMMKTGGYFLAQNFNMQDGDVLYFGNAQANQPSKLIQLVSQLFSPIMTVTSAVSIVQNSRN